LRVNEIEHSSIKSAHFSCEAMSLRVKRKAKLNRSIHAKDKHRSITDLNSDSRKNLSFVICTRRLPFGTIQFRGIASLLGSAGQCCAAACSRLSGFHHLTRPQPCAAMTNARADFLVPRNTEFISVSGVRPERTALHSDTRLKRLSGYVAAPELPHAPMNSPAAFRAGFPSQLFAN
jgi:hypothetical protein